MAGANNINRKLEDYLSSVGITEERVIELIRMQLLTVIGDLNNLETNDKSLIVNAINEIATNSAVSKELEERLDEVFQLGNDVKQMLVDALIANGIEENISTSDSFSTLISYIDWFNYYKGYNIFKFSVSAGTTIALQNELRGDTFSGTIYTNWGDGTVDTNSEHTYTTNGTYTVVSKYNLSSFNDGTYESQANARTSLIDVLNINKNINDASYMFYNCSGLTVINGNDWDTSNITNLDFMFADCSNLTTLNNEKWNVSNVESATNMTANCTKLK